MNSKCRRALLPGGPTFSLAPSYSPRVEPESKEKPEPRPNSHEDFRLQKELLAPGTVDFTEIQKEQTPRPKTSSAFRFGSLSHHSFFSRHHPHPQHVGHIQDFTGNRVCTVRDEFSPARLPYGLLLGCGVRMPRVSTPIGDPHSNREPLLYSNAWKKELKQLSSRLAEGQKEGEPKDRKEKEHEESQREPGAKYSAQTGRLIPPPTRATSRLHPHQTPGKPSQSKYGGTQAFFLEDQELLVLELLCQILQTDSLTSIQSWLLGSSQKEKDTALSFLSKAMAQLRSRSSAPISEEQLLNQLQEVQEKGKSVFTSYRQSQRRSQTLQRSEKPECLGNAQVLRMHSQRRTEEKVLKTSVES